MDPTLEDLMRTSLQSGSAVGNGVAVIAYDFSKTPTSGTVGLKKVGLTIPANRLIEPGFLSATTATTGTFSIQAAVSGDVIPDQVALASGTIVKTTQATTGISDREILLNVKAVATGKVLIFLKVFPLQ